MSLIIITLSAMFSIYCLTDFFSYSCDSLSYNNYFLCYDVSFLSLVRYSASTEYYFKVILSPVPFPM